jgi:orotidine-5'-phosphate decarboxylase
MSIGLIVALDKLNVCDQSDTAGLFHSLKDVTGFKITHAAFLNGWIEDLCFFIQYMQTTENRFYDLLVDFKIADVGVQKVIDLEDETGNPAGQKTLWKGTNSEIIKSLAYSVPVSHITVHGFPGEMSVRECVETAKEFNIDVQLLSSMTHAGSKQFMKYPEYMEAMIELGKTCGVAGFIAPGNDSEFLSNMVGKIGSELSIWSPGFGRQVTLRGGDKLNIEEQIYAWKNAVCTANREHLDNRIIVGSYIVEDDEPEKRVDEVLRYLKAN